MESGMRQLHALFGMRRRFQASNFKSGILPKRSYRTHGEINRGDTDLGHDTETFT